MNKPKCKWIYGHYPYEWNTSCGSVFKTSHSLSIPTTNGFEYCPFCGNKLTIER